jgi:hypothetical protein
VLQGVAAAVAAPEATLARVTRTDAELRAQLRDLQEEVLTRAKDARASASAGAGQASRVAAAAEVSASEPPPKLLSDAIKELQSELALAVGDVGMKNGGDSPSEVGTTH